MDSYDQQVEFESPVSQQSRLSGFFRNVHTRFSPFIKDLKAEKVEDVVISPQPVKKKTPLVVGIVPNKVDRLHQSTCLNSLATSSLSAPVCSHGNVIDPKKESRIIQVGQAEKNDSVLSKQVSGKPIVGHSDGDTLKQPNAGAGVKRKATELEDVLSKRIDARVREVSFPTSNSNAFQSPKPVLRNPLHDHSIMLGSGKETVKDQVTAKNVTWELDSDWIHEPSATPAVASHKAGNNLEHVVEDAITQRDSKSLDTSPSATSMLPSDNALLESPHFEPKEIRIDSNVGNTLKEGFFKEPSTEFSGLTDDIDAENCITEGRFQRKDVQSGDKWSLPVDTQGNTFSCKLKEILSKPIDHKEFSEMWALVIERKPILKLRQMRGRTMHVPTDNKARSYLDHHPDLAKRLEEFSDVSSKLSLLRGFFFWLQHSCMEGAYKPWALAPKNDTQEGDCVFTDGPDCEVLAVVMALDEKKIVSSFVKPLDPVTVDLSDDDDDDCLITNVTPPVKAVQETNFQTVTPCNTCFKEFGTDKDRQRALYETCGHIDTCMSCVDKFWRVGKQDCRKCGAPQSVKPRSVLDFADSC